MRMLTGLSLVVVLLVVPRLSPVPAALQKQAEVPDLDLFFLSASDDDDRAAAALDEIAAGWRDGYVAIFRDLIRLMAPPRDPPARSAAFDVGRARGGRDQTVEFPTLTPDDPSTRVWRRLVRFVGKQADIRIRERASDLSTIQQWMWSRPYDPHPEYARFKGLWYGRLDPGFEEFFPPGVESTVRLDEVDWGGVAVNGIPPLVYPRSVPAGDPGAEYLDDEDVVFGIAVDGDTRAYPKRILAWHEMALDRLGGLELTIVYCTLCGTVIPYESDVDGEHITFGTSGLLYRSNKLMFDLETKSLWNTFEGVPVVGPRVGTGIRLTHRSVVTTTWEEWRRKHPETTVLTLATGYNRDYSEGAAYRDYFATDDLMFEVPELDDRLDNKDEVLVLLVEDAGGERQPLALAADFLEDNRLYHIDHAGRSLLVVTSREGANRVYSVGDLRFARQRDDDRVVDVEGGTWQVREDALVLESDPSRRLERYAAQRAFWFGWYSQFPETHLVR